MGLRLTRSPSGSRRHTLGGLAAVLLWSTSVPVARALAEKLGPLTAGSAVFLLAGVLCLAWSWRARSPRPVAGGQCARRLAVSGACFVFYVYALYRAVGLAADRRQVLDVAMLNYLWPALTLLLAVPLLGLRARPLLLPGTLLALAGEALALSPDSGMAWSALAANLLANPEAYALAALAALSWALYSSLTRRWAPLGQGAVPFYMLAAGLALLLLRVGAAETGGWTPRALLELAFLATATALSYAAWEGAMRHGDVVLVAASSYFTPLLSALLTCAYLQVVPGPRLWAGCLALVAGSLLSWISVRGPEAPQLEAEAQTAVQPMPPGQSGAGGTP
ncbi:MAG: aromatic amino acid DMT transporter YddG [Candidatus Latescibacterota bacterium]